MFLQLRRPRAAVAACALCMLAVVPALGQTTPSQEAVGTKNWFRERFKFGGRLSVAGNDLLGAEPFVQATSNPPVHLTRTTDWTKGRIGGGPVIQFRICDRLGLEADLIHRRAGYTFTETLVTGVDLSSTSTNEQKTVTTTERTQVKYWDVPVLARLYFGRRHDGADFRRFISSGVAVRRVGGVSTTRNINGPDSENTNNTIAPVAANRTVLGWVGAAGVEATDDFGLRLTPEVRYTHWTSEAFSYAPARPRHNQVEFMVGITF